MNMFTKLLETLGNNFWLIIILCLEVILAVWLLCFARGKKKNRAAEPDGHSVQGALIALMVIWNVDLNGLFACRSAVPSRCFWAASQGIISVRKSPCRRLSSFCGNFAELIVKIDGFAKKVDEFLMM